jgi:hypothetical protein
MSNCVLKTTTKISPWAAEVKCMANPNLCFNCLVFPISKPLQSTWQIVFRQQSLALIADDGVTGKRSQMRP